MCYASRDTSPAYDMGIDDVVLLNAYSMISEYSIGDGTESVYTCDLYVVRNISLCTTESEAVIEHSTSTDIDLYTYNYENSSFIWQCTNHYEGLGAATIQGILYKNLLLSDTPVIRP